MTDTQLLQEVRAVLERRRVVLGVPLGFTQVEDRTYSLTGTSDDIAYVPAQALEVGGEYRLTLTVSDTAGNTSEEQVSLQVKTSQQLARDEAEEERQAAQDAVTALDADQADLDTIVERLRDLLPESPTDLTNLTEQATLRREKQAENFNTLFGGLVDRLAQWFTSGTGVFHDGVLAFIQNAENFFQSLQGGTRLARGWFEQMIVSTARGFRIIAYGSASNLFALVGGAGDIVARSASVSIAAVSSQLTDTFDFDLTSRLAQLNERLAIPQLYNPRDIQDRQNRIANALTSTRLTFWQRIVQAYDRVGIALETGQDTRVRQGLRNRQAINTFLEDGLRPITNTGTRMWRLAQYNIEVLFDQDPTRIENIRVTSLSPTSAVVEWDTNHLTRRGKVSYGTDVSQPYTGEVFEEAQLSRQHRVEISDLSAQTTYFFEIVSQNGGFVFDAYYAFTTPAEGEVVDVLIPQTAIIRPIADNPEAQVPIYEEPSTESDVLTQSESGDEFRALTVVDGWTSVLLPSGKRGWVQTEFVEFVRQTGPSGQTRTFDE